MNRVLIAMMVPVLAIMLVAISLAFPDPPVPAQFNPAECRRLDIVDQQFRRIAGIEDMQLTSDDRLFFTAYNRYFPDSPARGVFVLDLNEMDPDAPIYVDPLRNVGLAVRVLRPHGFALDRAAERFAFINRPAEGRAEVVWGTVENGSFSESGRWDGEGSCRANDLLYRGAELLVSLDRASCAPSLTDLMPGSASGRVVSVGFGQVNEVAKDLSFPNGLFLNGGELVVAETRGDRLWRSGGAAPFELPGGPDNLTNGPAGTMVAALHMDLFDYWLYSMRYSKTTGSRIEQISLRSGERRILFDDPLGETFSGASVAVLSRGRLFAGSAYDLGILACGL
ncbi:MAG: hypothetical protein AAF074_11490 [Pseudomonadota bacterium]